MWLAALVLMPASALGGAPINENKPFAEHFIVLQLSDADSAKHALVLSVAYNLLAHYGPDLVDIVVVAFGPGIEMVFADYKNVTKVNSLVTQGVRFVGCRNTIETITRKTGDKPELNSRIILVQTGAAYILELIEQGYTLIRP
ncbi:MAG: hypothetical protein L0H83_03100 [Salinisphaera sp.]|nr:hypothetical protein [Salinisphaera sp.]